MKSHFSVRKRSRDHQHSIAKRRKLECSENTIQSSDQAEPPSIETLLAKVHRTRSNTTAKGSTVNPALQSPVKTSSRSNGPKSLSPVVQSPMKPPSSPFRLEVTAGLRKKFEMSPSHLRTPPASPITARQCLASKKMSPSPIKVETRGEAAVRMALERYGKSLPSTPPPVSEPTHSPKLEKFEVFEFTSPQKKPRYFF